MSNWETLDRELDAWAEAGKLATLWWRDDDATTATPELAGLVASAARHRVPLCLAVIPATADRGLAALLDQAPHVRVVQHGYAHRNHAPTGAKKSELGPERPHAAIVEELVRGHARLADLFGDQFLAVLVPPWNRIAPVLLADLPGIGIRGLSTYGARAVREPAPGLVQVNTHVDPIDWRGSRGFLGEAAALSLLLDHLAARRLGRCDTDEATGLLTHHAVADAAGNAFVDRLLKQTTAHTAARWIAADAVFGLGSS